MNNETAPTPVNVIHGQSLPEGPSPMNSSTRAGASGALDKHCLRTGLCERPPEDGDEVGAPRARALLEALAEARGRMSEAFDVYRVHCEMAWRLGSQADQLRDYAPRA
jgi:hypothetical protein